MIKQDTLENQVKIVYLSLGSNLGDKFKNIDLAKYKLQLKGVKIIRSSSNYKSLSWPNPKNPKFINIVLKVRTFSSPFNLLKICKNIEKQLGRVRSVKNEPRTCDIDIIDYNQIVLSHKGVNPLYLPHPEVSKRNFVLMPLYEISKTWKHPKTKVKISKLISLLKIDDLRSIKQI